MDGARNSPRRPARPRRAPAARRRVASLAACLLASQILGCGDRAAGPPRAELAAGDIRLTIEVEADDRIHFEYAPADAATPAGARLPTSPMVARVEGAASTRATADGRGGFRTAALALGVDPGTLCLALDDATSVRSQAIVRLCPRDVGGAAQSLDLTPGGPQSLYGLGEHFLPPGQPAADLAGSAIEPGSDVGNALTAFAGGNTGRAQFPILYALGADGRGYALFVDSPYAQRWDLSSAPWRVALGGAAIRGYLIGVEGPLALRQAYMDVVGRPLVPPRKAFGLWVSEFGFDGWRELEGKLASLRANRFPVDGFMLDLEWFGGVFRAPSHMGALRFDEASFPDPAGEIARLRDEQGVGLMTIEEPYVDRSQPAYDELARRGDAPLACAGCGPVAVGAWWGHGTMLDWTNPAAADRWHDEKRQPLVDLGILGHWTDLGEPEDVAPGAYYAGFPDLDLHAEADVHNLYNLDWAASIQRGYERNGVAARPFILSRSGTAGLQRFGGAMWSGDIGSNQASLAAQQSVQLHVSLSGIDYFGSDVGGFFRTAREDDLDELYTEWFADSALGDVPLRPHTENLCNCRETAPDRIGDPASNLENLRLRYRLIPYLYSLAHRAHLFGEPLAPPLVVYAPADPNVRTIADEKLLGRDLLFAAVVGDGATARDVYLPAGTWIDFHTQEWRDSAGEWIRDVPVRPAGLLRLPLYARAGAIVAEMPVDDQTTNALGRRLDGSSRTELVVRVYADARATEFTLYEDDGATVAYLRGALRTTVVSQQRTGDRVRVAVAPARGSYSDAPEVRDNVVELVARGADAPPASVELNGIALPRAATRSDFDGAPGGAWLLSAEGIILLRSGPLPVAARKEFDVRLAGS